VIPTERKRIGDERFERVRGEGVIVKSTLTLGFELF